MNDSKDRRFVLDGGSHAAFSSEGVTPDAATSTHDATGSRAAPFAGGSIEFDLPESGRYVRAHVIGIGGMGRVVQAFDRRLSREVALKEVIRTGSDAEVEVRERRLVREASITARLDHPGIVPVHDAGRLPDGNLYYAMRIVRGTSLVAAIKAAATAGERRHLLRHVLDACNAVAWAHRHGVIHRDLKPANIMVGEFGETQVVDWGLAALIESPANAAASSSASLPQSAQPDSASLPQSAQPDSASLPQSATNSDDAALTRLGTILGTPRYMSPEQATGLPATQRSDVWSLGCVLYEVVAGVAAVSEGSSEEVIERVKRGQTIDLERAAPELPPEVLAIVRRALQPDPSHRYEDAKALSRDLASHLDGQRVSAHAYTAWELVVRLARAWRKQLIVAGIALVALVAFVLVAFSEIEAERNRALDAEARALFAADSSRRAEDRVRGVLAESDVSLSRALTDEAIGRSLAAARPEAEVLAAHAIALGDSPLAMGVLASWDAMAAPTLLSRIPRPKECVDLDLSPDGRLLGCRERGAISLHRFSEPMGTSLSPTLSRLWRTSVESRGAALLTGAGLFATGTRADHTSFFALADGVQRPSPPMSCCGLAVKASDNGKTSWVAGAGALAAVKDGRAHEMRLCKSGEETAGTVDATGEYWALSCRDGTVFHGPIGGPMMRHETGFGVLEGDLQVRAAPMPDKGRAPAQGKAQRDRAPAAVLAFTRDRKRLLMGNTVGTLALYDLEAETMVRTMDSGVAMPGHIATSPDGRLAAILGDRSGVRIWDLETGDFRGSLPDLDVRSLRFVENGGSDLATLGDELRLWRLTAGPVSRLGVGDGVTSIAVAPDGVTLAVTRGKGLTVTTLDGTRLFDGSWHDTVVKGGAFSDDGHSYVATAGQSRRLTRFDTDTWSTFEEAFEIAFAVREATVLTPPGAARYWVAASHSCGAKAFFDGDAEPVDLLASYGCPAVNDLARSSNGRFLVMYDANEGALYLLDAHVAQIPRKLAHDRDATNLYLADDGRTLLAAEMDAITEWDLADASLLTHVFPARATAFLATAMSPDGRFVAGGARDGSTWLWERPTGRLRAVFRDHDQRTSAVTFVSNQLLATGSWDWTVRLRSLSVFDRPAADWTPLVERRWGLVLDDVLEGGLQ